ncbi:MAG: hypothetical protein ACYDBZ_20310 [Steroidobacteraceae bacterium]
MAGNEHLTGLNCLRNDADESRRIEPAPIGKSRSVPRFLVLDLFHLQAQAQSDRAQRGQKLRVHWRDVAASSTTGSLGRFRLSGFTHIAVSGGFQFFRAVGKKATALAGV